LSNESPPWTYLKEHPVFGSRVAYATPIQRGPAINMRLVPVLWEYRPHLDGPHTYTLCTGMIHRRGIKSHSSIHGSLHLSAKG